MMNYPPISKGTTRDIIIVPIILNTTSIILNITRLIIRNPQSSQPASIEYMDQPDNQPVAPNTYYEERPGSPETAGCEPPFIGYTVLNHGEPYGRYKGEMYPQADNILS